MKRIERLISRYKYIFMLIFLIPPYLWFTYCERHVVAKYIMHTRLDDMIPFVKVFVIPYLLWYAYIAFALIYTYRADKKNYINLLIFLGVGMFISDTVYMLFPNAQSLRPVITGNDVFSKMIRFIYATDTPTDVCPSMHVLYAVAVHCVLYHTESFRKRKYAVKASFVMMVIICMSTMFIKQHSVIDVTCGVVLALIFYAVLYKEPKVIVRQPVYESIKISK